MTLIKKLGLSAEPVYLVDGTAYITAPFTPIPT